MFVVLHVVGALLLIVAGSDAFTNAVEWVGATFGLTRSAIGAVVAAIGSSMPETAVAVVALLVLHDARSQAVGIGAVLGAPFMLSTVVFFLIGMVALLRNKQEQQHSLAVPVAPTVFGASLFFVTFALALAASFVRMDAAHDVSATLVLGAYVVYLLYHLRAGQPEGEESPPPLRLAPKSRRPASAMVIFQLVIALIVIVFASRWFVASVNDASATLGISPFLVSLFLSPIATELPEMANVVMWMRRREDALALGNVLGAMMFQTSIACAIAMLATPWQLAPSAYVASALALLSVAILIVTTVARRRVEPMALIAGGLLYVAYIVYTARPHS